MKLLIFKTDLESPKKVEAVKPMLNSDAHISHWTIDMEDIDNVLRIVADDSLKEDDIIQRAQQSGYHWNELPE